MLRFAPLLLLSLIACAAPGPQDYEVAFWNVENLFDPDDDTANQGDDEYLPDAGWTAERYALKLDRLAEVIAAVEPHVLGLAEVENRRVVEDLVAHPRLAALGYRVVHRESADTRGIDVALVYRAPFALRGGDGAVVLHPITKKAERPSRGVLEVPLEVDGTPLTVLVNHWPSRGGDRDGSYRRVAGEINRQVVDAIRSSAPASGIEEDVVVVGDLNDDPFDPSVRNALGAVRSRNAALNRRNDPPLYNPSWSLLGIPDEGTLYYNRDWVWNVFDQVIVTRGMLDEVGFTYIDGSYGTYAPDHLRDHYRRPRWFRKDRDGTWDEGYSDHFLVHCRVRRQI